MKSPTLRQVNTALSAIIVLLCLYLILGPFVPRLTFRFKPIPSLVALETKGQDTPVHIPDKNTLVIPSMRFQGTIHEGLYTSTLNKGVWHRPGTGAPGQSGNTVLTGHRFTYGGPAVLYHLDKVRVDDKIVLYWEKQRYEYRVARVREVPPTAGEIEGKTDDGRLTIYTCTPLMTAENRLVIVARPLNEEER